MKLMPKRKVHTEREAYLMAAAVLLYKTLFADNDIPTPEKYRVSCGWPAGKRKAIGQCFSTTMSSDGHNEMFVSPSQDDVFEVLQVLIHEMVHASDDCVHGHKGIFRRWALAVGLTGKMTATSLSESLRVYLEAKVVKKLGPYPHGKLARGGVIKKQTTRMIKIECRECGWIARASQTQVDRLGAPAACPVCTEIGLAPEYHIWESEQAA